MIFGLLLPVRRVRRRAAVERSTTRCCRVARADRRGHAGGRQPPPRQGLLPAGHALLRRQLGDHACGCSARHRRGGEVRPRDLQGRAGRRSSSWRRCTTRETAELHAQQGPCLPGDAQPRAGAQRAARTGARSTTSSDYFVREGEVISGVVNGWNFGDGHFHDEQLLDAVQERCEFAAGRAAGRHARVAAGAHPEAAVPHLRRRDRARRGGVGRGRGHGRAPALARRERSTSRWRSREGRAGREPAPVA